MYKVLHIVLGLQVGGLEKFVLDLVRNYQTQVRSVILCLEEKGTLWVDSSLDILQWEKKPGLDLRYGLKIARLVKEKNIDLIHTHNPTPHFYGAIGGWLAGVPVIHTKHGRNNPKVLKKVWLNRIASFLSRRVVAVSSDATDVCLQIERIPPSKVITILNGIDTERFVPGRTGSLGKRLSVPEAVPLLGIVARLSQEKDHSTLIAACKLLKDGGTAFRLVIIGDGPLRGDLEVEVERCGLQDHVFFMGMRHDIPELVRELDLFVLSSITEGVSLTLLEAMSSGVPIVATDVGGNPEVVVDGRTGLIVPARSPECMAQKIKILLTAPELRKKMGEAAMRRVLGKFSLGRAAEQYLRLYQDVLVGR